MAIAGRISHFDWLEVEKVSISWSLIGCGKYRLRKTVDLLVPPNRAMDVYINEWAQIQPFIRSEITQQKNSSISKPVFSYDPINLPVARNIENIG